MEEKVTEVEQGDSLSVSRFLEGGSGGSLEERREKAWY